jgi:hypothetical protein
MQKKDTLKLYSEISADISSALNSVDVLKEELAKVSFPKNATKKLDGSIEKIIEKINEFEYAAR